MLPSRDNDIRSGSPDCYFGDSKSNLANRVHLLRKLLALTYKKSQIFRKYFPTDIASFPNIKQNLQPDKQEGTFQNT